MEMYKIYLRLKDSGCFMCSIGWDSLAAFVERCGLHDTLLPSNFEKWLMQYLSEEKGYKYSKIVSVEVESFTPGGV